MVDPLPIPTVNILPCQLPFQFLSSLSNTSVFSGSKCTALSKLRIA